MISSLFETKDYPIFFEDQGFRALNESIRNSAYSGIFVLVDEHTFENCWPILHQRLSVLEGAHIIQIPSGEENKSLSSCETIWRQLLYLGADRKALLINLGGGVITDMGGFAAATFKRGIDFIHIPTTLLSQVDASVGSKLGIDFEGGKNQIGLFGHPRAVMICSDFLKTQGKRPFLSGFAEVVKHGLIARKELWQKCQSVSFGDPKELSDLIYESIKIKNDFVDRDPRDKGARHALNFGHTIGHALESHFLMDSDELPLLHGEAVAAGMIIEAYISYREVGLTHEELDSITHYLFSLYGAITLTESDFPDLLDWMRSDKKNADGEIRFCLIPEIGTNKVGNSVSDELITSALEYYIARATMELNQAT